MVQTCAHVVDALEHVKRRRGPKAFERGVQFVYPAAGSEGEWTTAFRSFELAHRDDRIDLALLALGEEVVPVPVTVVSHRYVPAVGEMVGLCGYAHGSILLSRGDRIDRIGPVVQGGIIAALSPFDIANPDRAILDLVTGPAASGSPIFRQDTGEVLGYLIEGQIKQSAAFSIARLMYRDEAGRLAARLRTDLQVTKLTRRSRGT